MITVVSGHRRSGTSMMMKALHESGMPIIVMESLNDMDTVPDDEGYIPNPSGVHEVGYLNTFRASFLRGLATHDLGLVKILYDAIVFLPKHDWKVIFMQRDPEEINMSCKRVDKYIMRKRSKMSGRPEHHEEERRQQQLEHDHRNLPFSAFRPYNQENIDHVLGIMESRNDVELIPVQYQDVIDDPVKVFERLKYTPVGKERLPIDIERAAAVINPDLHRIRA